jgi:hypothetical protein
MQFFRPFFHVNSIGRVDLSDWVMKLDIQDLKADDDAICVSSTSWNTLSLSSGRAMHGFYLEGDSFLTKTGLFAELNNNVSSFKSRYSPFMISRGLTGGTGKIQGCSRHFQSKNEFIGLHVIS